MQLVPWNETCQPRTNRNTTQEDLEMHRAVDLSHPWTIHTPPWMGYDSPRLYYTQRHSMGGVVSQWLETPLHVGTHLDSEMHGYSGGRDIGSVPLEDLYGDGVIVDISDLVGEFDIITPEHLTRNVEVRKGDILIIHTGWHKYYHQGPEEDEETYFCRHPGPYLEVAQWFIDMELKWTGTDTGSGDHPMNTAIRNLRPDIREEFEQKKGVKVGRDIPHAKLLRHASCAFPQGNHPCRKRRRRHRPSAQHALQDRRIPLEVRRRRGGDVPSGSLLGGVAIPVEQKERPRT